MCLDSEKPAISFLSLFLLDFLANIFFSSSTLRWNDTKRENHFNRFKLSFWSLLLYRSIWPEKLFHQFLLSFLFFFTQISGGKSFSTLDFVESIKNYIKSSLRQLKMRLSATQQSVSISGVLKSGVPRVNRFVALSNITIYFKFVLLPPKNLSRFLASALPIFLSDLN